MTTLRDILLKLSRREDLTRDEARSAFELIMSGQASEAQIEGAVTPKRDVDRPDRAPEIGAA